jgi:hypothetical protein
LKIVVKIWASVQPHACALIAICMTGQDFDVVVVGSGAAGMVAALTATHQGL